MSSAKAPAPPRRNVLRRLSMVYFVLAAFDLFTIGAALTLDHAITNALERHVRVSRELSTRMTALFELQHTAQAVGAPGNDVFASHDVAGERAARDAAALRFRQQWDALISAPEPRSARDYAITVAHLRAAGASFDAMLAVSHNIYRELEQRDIRTAGRFMAEQDRLLAQLVGNIENAVASVERVQIALAEEQLEFARSARTLEVLIAMALVAMIAGVAFYGMNIQRAQREYERSLEDAYRRLRHYADDVSHELRGPVNKMRLNMEVLLAEDASAEMLREGLEASLDECESLSKIINGLLFLARVENISGAQLKREATTVAELLESVSDFFSATAEERGIAVEARPAAAALNVDRALMQRAVANLVSNALSNTPAGGRIELSGAATDGGVEIVVSDNGRGIPPEQLPHIFERFRLTSDADKPDGAGLGIGLSITKAIAELHGGAVSLTSAPGAGTRAVIRLPAPA